MTSSKPSWASFYPSWQTCLEPRYSEACCPKGYRPLPGRYLLRTFLPVMTGQNAVGRGMDISGPVTVLARVKCPGLPEEDGQCHALYIGLKILTSQWLDRPDPLTALD